MNDLSDWWAGDYDRFIDAAFRIHEGRNIEGVLACNRAVTPDAQPRHERSDRDEASEDLARAAQDGARVRLHRPRLPERHRPEVEPASRGGLRQGTPRLRRP